MLCIGIGVIITKRGLFQPQMAKGVSVLAMASGGPRYDGGYRADVWDVQNVGLPSLIFSSMVSAFTPSNISAAGSLVIVALLYQTIGLALAWIVREVFYVPVDFQWGILTVSSSLLACSMYIPVRAGLSVTDGHHLKLGQLADCHYPDDRERRAVQWDHRCRARRGLCLVSLFRNLRKAHLVEPILTRKLVYPGDEHGILPPRSAQGGCGL